MGIWFAVVMLAGLSSVAGANEAHRKLLTLDLRDRERIMAILVNDYTAGDCPTVGPVVFVGIDGTGNAYWDVGCNNDGFRLQIGNEPRGPVLVMPCEVMTNLGSPCFRWIEGGRIE